MASRCTRRSLLASSLVAGGLVSLPMSSAWGRPQSTAWRASWGAALQLSPSPQDLPAGARLSRRVASSIAGDALRIELSNRFGPVPLTVRASIVAAQAELPVTIGGLDHFTIPAGAVAMSDPIAVPFAAGSEFDIVVELPAGGTIHDIERTAGAGEGVLNLPSGETSPAFAGIMATVEALSAPAPVYAVLGDTKGARPGSWVDLVARQAGGSLAMVNRSVYGGKLALGDDPSNALARFDHDVLATGGVTGMILFCGNNDLIQPGMIGSSGRPALDPSLMQSEAQLQALLGQAALRARSRGILAIGATWTPYEGVTIAQGYSSPDKMERRARVNDWIRNSGTFDHVLDFDAALRDPQRHSRLDPRFDAGNHFTPNEAGVQEMARTALELLTGLGTGHV